MDKDLFKARDRFIEGIGRLANTVGVSRVIGQPYATLFLSDKPLSLNDMVATLVAAGFSLRRGKENAKTISSKIAKC